MKGWMVGLVLGLGLLTSGCGAFDIYRDRQMPVPSPPQPHTRQAVPQPPLETPAFPPAPSLSTDQLPPYWYWAEKQQQEFDRYLQQQWMYYYLNRQPPPQFPRQPICTSTLLGGQVITTCH
ncbi:MAG: hypothetical protein E6K68_05845 [Nitrospirae bacterium]|nr:MAG: hypothetical protein E6K68_05845 [Nitrospirota bacterium]